MTNRVWAGLAVTVFTLAVLRRAWMCDDAFITMRVVDNLVAGRGLVFNVGERVLGITNPLWALFLAGPYALIKEPYLTAVMAGVLISALAAGLLAFGGRRDHEKGTAALVLVALCFSRSFVDFSTSGLENSLTHLLLFAFYRALFAAGVHGPLQLAFWTSLILVNRLDAAPLVVFGLVWSTWLGRRDKRTYRALWGLLPVLCWLAFATLYFGFPAPNTTYAKLNSDIPREQVLRQGLSYLLEVVTHDTQTAILVLVALALVGYRARRESTARVVLLGMLVDLGYVVSVGGDFMSGRFLTAITAVSAVSLVHYGAPLLQQGERFRAAVLTTLAFSVSLSFSPFRDERALEKREFPASGIVNERAWYQDHLLLHANLRPVAWREDGLYRDGVSAKERGDRVTVMGNIGLFSWGAGPGVHVLDPFALTDPLLARIPFAYERGWRTGHLGRPVPEGYVRTLETGKNLIADKCLSRYYQKLNRVIRGPLFTRDRWSAILELNSRSAMTVRPCPAS